MVERSRRSLLQRSASVLTGGLALAGCTSQDDRSRSTPTLQTETTTATAAGPLAPGTNVTVGNAPGPDAEGTVALAAVRGQRQYFVGRLSGGGGRRDVRGAPDQTYLHTTFDISWTESGRDLFMDGTEFARVVLDGEAFPITHPAAFVSGEDPEHTGEVIFAVPADRSPSKGRVEWLDDGETVAAWDLPEETLAWLADPPVFEVQRAEGPEQVREGTRGRVRIVVANTGGSDGTFRYLVDSPYTSAARLGRLPVPAGDTAEAVRTPVFGEGPTGAEPDTALIEWGQGSTTVEVTLTGTDDTTTTGEGTTDGG